MSSSSSLSEVVGFVVDVVVDVRDVCDGIVFFEVSLRFDDHPQHSSRRCLEFLFHLSYHRRRRDDVIVTSKSSTRSFTGCLDVVNSSPTLVMNVCTLGTS